MLRFRVPTSLAALPLALAALAMPAGAQAADPVSADAISALLGGTPAAKQIREGQYSPDRTRILYRVLSADAPSPGGGESAVEHDGAYWSVRADGSQPTQLSITGGDDVWVHDAMWRADGMVRFRLTTVQGDSLASTQEVITTTAGTDEWAEAAPGVGGEPTADGRFRVTPFSDLVLDDRAGGPSIAYEVETGDVFVVAWAAPQLGGLAWRSDCGDADRNPAQTLLGAVTGPTPACRFAREVGDGYYPGDEDWADPADVAELVDVDEASIFSARYSPDGSRVLFKVAVDPTLPDPSSDPLEGDYWVVRTDGTQLTRLTTSTGTSFQAIRARWTSNTAIELQYGLGSTSSRIVDGLTTAGDTDCWNTLTPATDAGHAAATTITSTACGTTTPEPTTPEPTTPQPTTPEPGAPSQTTPPAGGTQPPLSQPIPTTPGLQPAKVLAVGTKLGGKKKNLLTVKFTSPAGYGARVTLALRDGGKVLAKIDLSVAQAKTGYVRLTLSAKSRKLLTKSKGRVTVRVVPLSA